MRKIRSEAVNTHRLPVSDDIVHLVPCVRRRVVKSPILNEVKAIIKFDGFVPVVNRRSRRSDIVAGSPRHGFRIEPAVASAGDGATVGGGQSKRLPGRVNQIKEIIYFKNGFFC